MPTRRLTPSDLRITDDTTAEDVAVPLADYDARIWPETMECDVVDAALSMLDTALECKVAGITDSAAARSSGWIVSQRVLTAVA